MINPKWDGMLDKATELLVMCSSRQRPDRLQTTINTFNETRSPGTELVVYISEDDPRLGEYKEMLGDMKHLIGSYKTMIQVLNYLSCERFPGLPYYAEVNDDHAYRTVGWDKKMMRAIDDKKGWAIAYGWTQNLPTAIMMSGKLVRTMGFFLPPQFIHTHVDNFVMVIGQELGLLTHLPDVVIDHLHHAFGKAQMDENYKLVYSGEMLEKGYQIFCEWQEKHKAGVLDRVREAMSKE